MAAAFANSPFDVYDWSALGQFALNQRLPLPPTGHPDEGVCCASNYSAAWDADGELFAVVVDNLVCPGVLKEMRQDALGGTAGPDDNAGGGGQPAYWETQTQAINRIHQHGARLGEHFYVGNFPGVTKRSMSANVLMTMRRCMRPFAGILLDSEMFHTVRTVIPASDVQDQPRKHADMREGGGAVGEEYCLQRGCVFAPTGRRRRLYGDALERAGQEEEEEEDEEETAGEEEDYDPYEDSNDEDGDSSAEGFRGRDPRLVGVMPIAPILKRSFWASVSVPPHNISLHHSTPHTDGFAPGLASVFTLSDDPKYEVSGTSLNRAAQVAYTILTCEKDMGTIQTTNTALLEEARASGQSEHEGWCNGTGNRYSDVLVVAKNRYNRFTMYPANRLHTAYIPDPALLEPDPRKGRLTANTFWTTYRVRTEDGDSAGGGNMALPGKEFCHQLAAPRDHSDPHYASTVPHSPAQADHACRKCSEWTGYCGWCTSSAKCIPVDQFSKCGSEGSGNIVNRGPLGPSPSLTCEAAVARASPCLTYQSCEACTSDGSAGCAWCLDQSVCLPDGPRTCANKILHVGSSGNSSAACFSSDKMLPLLQPGAETVPAEAQRRLTDGSQGAQDDPNSGALALSFATTPSNHDCTVHTVCHSCLRMGCAWCPRMEEMIAIGGIENLKFLLLKKPCRNPGLANRCGVESYVRFEQCKEVRTDIAPPREGMPGGAKDTCFPFDRCESCLENPGCGWCSAGEEDQGTGNGGTCIPDSQPCEAGPENHVSLNPMMEDRQPVECPATAVVAAGLQEEKREEDEL